MREELLKLIQDLKRTHASNTGDLDQLEAKIEQQNTALKSMEEKMRVLVCYAKILQANVKCYDFDTDRLASAELRNQLEEWEVL